MSLRVHSNGPKTVLGGASAIHARLPKGHREPDARLPQAEAAGAVFIEAERVARFLTHLEAEGRTGRYRQNVRTYLAQWAEALPGEGIVSGVTFP